jgi:Tfp pilus assembly protein PilZ
LAFLTDAEEDLNKSAEIDSVSDRLVSLVLKLTEEQQATLLGELEMKLSNERRYHRRRSLVTVVDFATQGRAYREFTKDLGNGGVYIETANSFSVGQEMTLTFFFPVPQKHVRIIGRVARADHAGIGIKFNMKSLSGGEIQFKSFISETAFFHPLPGS